MSFAFAAPLGASVSRTREQAGLTQVRLAVEASIHQAEITRIERGHENPAVSTLVRFEEGAGSRSDLAAASS